MWRSNGLPEGDVVPCLASQWILDSESVGGPRGLPFGGPDDCQEVLIVSVKRVGRIGGPKRTARWLP
eukprot:SAG11_NODE_10539_length_823_cov_6.675414_1_plen_67_part_00